VFRKTAVDNLTFGYRVTDTFLKFFLVGTRKMILSVAYINYKALFISQSQSPNLLKDRVYRFVVN